MRSLKRAGPLALVALLVLLILPFEALASSAELDAAGEGTLGDTVPIDTMRVVLAAVLVLFMQAGFVFLEVGLVRS